MCCSRACPRVSAWPSSSRALRAMPGVASIHDLHVWSISSGKVSLTVHVVKQDGSPDAETILSTIQAQFEKRFGITHITVQMESAPCHQTNEAQHFEPHAHEGHAH